MFLGLFLNCVYDLLWGVSMASLLNCLLRFPCFKMVLSSWFLGCFLGCASLVVSLWLFSGVLLGPRSWGFFGFLSMAS